MVAAIPVLERKEAVQESATPDFQSSFQNYAESANRLSAIGAKVAQTASNQLATQLGYEEGKKPHGDLTPSITEFDENFAKAYHAQSDATLSLQGQKLLDDAHVELSKPARLTPQLIESTNAQVQAGLNKIAEQAPLAVKADLQAKFNSQLLNQTSQYKEKMITQQREDERNNIINAIDLNNKKAYELSIQGDATGANKYVESTRRLAESGYANRHIDKEQSRVAQETIQQSVINGTYINQAKIAEANGKLAEFEKDYADKKIPGTEKLTNEQHVAAGIAVRQQMNFYDTLRSQDENLKAQNMINDIATNPNSITSSKWTEFENSVSPLKAAEVKFKYIQALKANQKSTGDANSLITNWSNPEAQANASPSTQKESFNKLVDYTQQVSSKSSQPLTHEEAQVQVAASAGSKVNVFTDELKNKLHSGNPAQMESAALQIHALREREAGHALSGLNDEDNSIASMYELLRGATDPTTAAKDTIDNIINQDPAVQKMVKQKWSEKLWLSTKSGITPDQFALSSVNLTASQFLNPTIAQVYATNILGKYSASYQTLKGNDNLAKKLTQQYVDENFGETGVNGGRDITFHPIEKQLGFKSNDAVPYIHEDIARQFNEHLKPLKEQYESKKLNEYWEVQPVNKSGSGLFHTTYQPLQIKRHYREDNIQKEDTFNVILMGNSFNSYDVAIETNSGMRNLYQFAPYLGIVTYKPDKKYIVGNYNKDHQLK